MLSELSPSSRIPVDVVSHQTLAPANRFELSRCRGRENEKSNSHTARNGFRENHRENQRQCNEKLIKIIL